MMITMAHVVIRGHRILELVPSSFRVFDVLETVVSGVRSSESEDLATFKMCEVFARVKDVKVMFSSRPDEDFEDLSFHSLTRHEYR